MFLAAKKRVLGLQQHAAALQKSPGTSDGVTGSKCYPPLRRWRECPEACSSDGATRRFFSPSRRCLHKKIFVSNYVGGGGAAKCLGCSPDRHCHVLFNGYVNGSALSTMSRRYCHSPGSVPDTNIGSAHAVEIPQARCHCLHSSLVASLPAVSFMAVDELSGLNFLVDTGACQSFVPKSPKKYRLSPYNGPRINTADGTPLRIYGVKNYISRSLTRHTCGSSSLQM